MPSPLVLNDRYRLDRRLAAGGMGEVWQGTDQVLSRSVAVKLLKQQFIADPTSRERFRAEARFAAALQHGGIAQVYDYGEQDDLAYLVMELVPGEPLSKILSRAGRLSAEVTMDLIGQAARALTAAHAAGIIHRDIKPANLMVTADGIVKITDFGIARGGETTTMTQTGMVMGTAQYVSPEQATGQRITPSSDLYSLGVVAYECLSGMPPFAADTPVALALMHVREDAPPLPIEVPAPVRALVGGLMAKEPADRPQGAQEVADRAYLIRESMGFVDDLTTAENRAVRTRAAATAADVAVTAAAPTTRSPAATTRSAVPAAGTTRIPTQDLPDGPPPRRGRAGRAILVTACVVAVIGAAVFTAGLMWKDPRHSKLIDGNRIAPVHTRTTTHSRRGHHPRRSTHSVVIPRRPTPSSTPSSPRPKPTRTTPSPEPTPTRRTTSPSPTTPTPTPTGGTQDG